jgi:outer membrane protein TolC
MASNLYDDLYVSARALEVNEQHQVLLEQFRKSAEAQYIAGRASQQDPLQAEVELAHLEHFRIVLEADRDIAAAQLNGLLHRAPQAPLPPPPAEQPGPGDAPAETGALQQQALADRPELRGQTARIRSARARIDAARREFYPDFEVMGSYDSMWAMPEHQWMLGIGLNIPLQRGRRHAAVEEAEAMAARARNADRTLRDRIRVEVERAAVRVHEGIHVLQLVQDRLLPAARDQVDAALAGFVTGRNAFLAVIEAEKNLRAVELNLHRARADLARRIAALDRAVGRVPGLSNGGAR